MNNESPDKSIFHPITIFTGFLTFFIMSLLFTDPIFLFLMFFITMAYIVALGGARKMFGYIKYIVFFMFVYSLFNVFFSQHGKNVLFQFVMPVFGNVKISAESIFFSFTIMLKMLLIYSIFYAYSIAEKGSRNFFHCLLNRYPKLAITFIMSLTFLKRLPNEFSNVSQVVKGRVSKHGSSNYAGRMHYYFSVLKSILLLSLEYAWGYSEVLYSKAFDSGKRTDYYSEKLKVNDLIVIAAFIFSIIAAAYFASNSIGVTNFYPTVSKINIAKDIKYAFIALWPFIFFNISMIKGRKNVRID